MNQEIRPKGLKLSPDDRAATPGELAMCGGAELHDGTLRPSFVDGTEVRTLKSLINGAQTVHTLIYVHEGASYTNYITSVGSDLFWWDKDSLTGFPKTISNVDATKIKDISSVGNTLCIVTDTGIHYVLFKAGTTPGYKYLGTQPPFVNIQFSLAEDTYTGDLQLKLGTAAKDMYDLDNQTVGSNPAQATFGSNLAQATIREDFRTEFSDAAYALINRVHSEITEAGRFYAPFFIRYCYRLCDGTSFILHSPPVLMPVCIGHENCILVNGLFAGNKPGSISVNSLQSNALLLSPYVRKLQFRNNSSSEWTTLKDDWKDIVASLDVFISQPITRTKQGEQFKYVGQLSDADTLLLYDGDIDYQETSYLIFAYPPEIEKQTYDELLFQPGIFFKVASFKLTDSLPTTDFEDFPIEGTVLAALAAQEHMKDDYRSHHQLLADSSVNRHSFVYNKRLHVFAVKEQLFSGFTVDAMLPWIDDNLGFLADEIYVRIATEEGDKLVSVNETHKGALKETALKNIPLFYPDSRAYQMIITNHDDSAIYQLPMTRLPLLEGAVTTGEFTKVNAAPSQGDNTVATPNKIYVSEINNPFFFPLEARQTVGVGTIYGLGVATRAISPGQFGDHDLMVFCSDGIWALTVNRETGTYSSSHNVSREVCSNPKSICQLDQSIVFATKRGLSRIVEQDAVSLSDALYGPLFDLSDLSIVSEFSSGTSADPDIVKLINFATSPVNAPVNVFQTCTILYDYAKERLILVPGASASQQPAYVLSLRDGAWSTILLPTVTAVVNAYPHPYFEDADGKLYVLNKPFEYNVQNPPVTSGLIVSRTLSFAQTMQVIQAFQQINDCETVPVIFLYGSNDSINWQLLGKAQRNHAPYLPGYPYRFFRFAVYLKMKPHERYSSLILDVIEKYQKL